MFDLVDQFGSLVRSQELLLEKVSARSVFFKSLIKASGNDEQETLDGSGKSQPLSQI
jgi:hypothetical protein